MISGDGIDIEITDFEKIIINKKVKKFFWNPKGLMNGIKYFINTPELNLKNETPSLKDALRITSLTIDIDKSIEKLS